MLRKFRRATFESRITIKVENLLLSYILPKPNPGGKPPGPPVWFLTLTYLTLTLTLYNISYIYSLTLMSSRRNVKKMLKKLTSAAI